MDRLVRKLLSLIAVGAMCASSTALAKSDNGNSASSSVSDDKDKNEKKDKDGKKENEDKGSDSSDAKENQKYREIADQFDIPTPDLVNVNAVVSPVKRVTDSVTQTDKGFESASLHVMGVNTDLEISGDNYAKNFNDNNINIALSSSIETSAGLAQCKSYSHEARLNSGRSVRVVASGVPYGAVHRDPDDIARAKSEERYARYYLQYIMDVLASVEKQNASYKKLMDSSLASARSASSQVMRNAHSNNAARYKSLIDANILRGTKSEATYRKQVEDALRDAKAFRLKHRKELIAALKEQDKQQELVDKAEAHLAALKSAGKTAEASQVAAGLRLLVASLQQSKNVVASLMVRPHRPVYLNVEKHSASCS